MSLLDLITGFYFGVGWYSLWSARHSPRSSRFLNGVVFVVAGGLLLGVRIVLRGG